MSYITPDTTIYLCSGVPLDNTYQHSLYWTASDASAQLSYIQSFVTYKLTDYTYQRVNKGVIRCGVNAENIYNVNYLCFQNSAYGDRWFYAFVNSVEYVNDNTTDVFYEIDVLQTWWFDITWRGCWIERQHTTTDYIGENIQPEPLKCTDYGYVTTPEAWGLSELCIIVAVCDVNTGATNSVIVDNNFSGATLYAFSLSEDGASGVETIINNYIEAEDSILSIYLAPSVAIYSTDLDSGNPLTIYPQGYSAGTKTFDALTAVSPMGWKNSNQGTFVPENCKLLTYPYTYFSVSDANGGSLVCPYEYFYQGTPAFGSICTITQPVEVMCYPIIYKGSGTATTDGTNLYNVSRYYPEALTLSDFPMCSWNYDAYKTWIAQNATPILNNLLGSISSAALSAGTSLASGNVSGVLGAANSLWQTSLSLNSQVYSASIAADVSRGTFSNGGVNAAGMAKDFFMGRMSIDYYTALRYDDFFNQYGYAINERAVPNLCARPYYTFVQTSGCVIEATAPGDDINKICKIMDNGCTFWNASDYPNYVLHYDADNRPENRGAKDW